MFDKKSFVKKYNNLIDIERSEQKRQFLSQIKNTSAKKREAMGNALLDMQASRAGKRFNYHVVRFSRSRALDTKISSGDLILVSRGAPLKSDLSATVLKVSNRFVEAAFDAPLPKWCFKQKLRIDLYLNDIPFMRMQEALEALGQRKKDDALLRLLFDKEAQKPKSVVFEPFDANLNDSQKSAVAHALGSKYFLIHGPPGTGKTTTMCELARQCVARGEKLLITADSNTACDTILQKLHEKTDLDLLRVGHVARVLPGLEETSLFVRYEKHPAYKEVQDKRQALKDKLDARDAFVKPTPGRKRGMSLDRIQTLAAKNASQRGVDAETMRSMDAWIKHDKTIQKELDIIKYKEDQALQSIIDGADIVVCTNSAAGSQTLENKSFDRVLIDEGSQQVIPSTLIAMQKAPKAVIAGDHMQLPPTVQSPKASDLAYSLFEKLIETYPGLSQMLDTQYRMHRDLIAFSKRVFYNNKLHTAKANEAITPRDLSPGASAQVHGFIDSCTNSYAEQRGSDATSFYNVDEIELVSHQLQKLTQQGISQKDIGIISPYQGQVRALKDKLCGTYNTVEINSIDGFQGREKEIIILSFVRSNSAGNIGFLNDYRRLNVALTRAKRCLIAVGCAKTLRHDPIYDAWLGEM